jgi:serine/threonine protein kinase
VGRGAEQHYRRLQVGDLGDALPAALSTEARQLLRALLQPHAHRRLTAQQALAHPWLLAGVTTQHEAQRSTTQHEAQRFTSQHEAQRSTTQHEAQRSTTQHEAQRSTSQYEAQRSTTQYEAAAVAILRAELSSQALCQVFYRLLDHAGPGGMPARDALHGVVVLAHQVRCLAAGVAFQPSSQLCRDGSRVRAS